MLIDKEAIYTEYYSQVLRYVTSQVNDFHLAEDITSDVFLKIYEKLNTYNSDKAGIKTWIFTITRNHLIDYYRTRKVTSEIDENIAIDEDEPSFSDEDLELLADALNSIDERLRKIVVLHYYSNESLKDIAQELGISYIYTKVLHARALEALKKYLKK